MTSQCTAMDHEESRGLLKSLLGFFARRPPETSNRSPSPKSKALEAWLRTDSYLQLESDDFDQSNPEQVMRTRAALENLIEHGFDRPTASSLNELAPYPEPRNLMEQDTNGMQSQRGAKLRSRKRKHENEAAIKELSQLEIDGKRRRILPREEPTMHDELEELDADLAMQVRKHSLSLHHCLRRHWTCVCHKCSGLSVRASLPQRRQDTTFESCFEVFFGVKSVFATTLQEAKITVKDAQEYGIRSAYASGSSVLPDFAHICQSITESLDQRNCLNLILEDGSFKRLRPQPKTFGEIQMSRTVSLSSLFRRQQELRDGSSALPLKGKRILAVTLATALLPFLETPWVQPSFDHSKIRFFQPLRNEELPNITKPFLDLEHIPIISQDNNKNYNNYNVSAGNGEAHTSPVNQIIHPNASVLALGILLCELHHCKPIESLRTGTETTPNVNTDFYTGLEILNELEADAGVDYYLATRACLKWEYYPAGEPADFESYSVQKLFYQNVIKRLESEIFKSWGLRVEDLQSLDSKGNELCWGQIGKNFVRGQMAKADFSANGNELGASSLHPEQNIMSLANPSSSFTRGSQTPTRTPFDFHNRPDVLASAAKTFHLFDASHQIAATQDGLSENWMNTLLSSIHAHVDPVQIMTPSFEPVRIAILDSGCDPTNPVLLNSDTRFRIKDVRNFVHQTELSDVQDEIGHGTHALGLLLQVAPCAEIYVARIANKQTLGRESYNDIAKAINHAVLHWKVDIISMSFGIREIHEPIKAAITNAQYHQTLLFAAASNDGGNRGRAFPAAYPSVFCIHSTDGNGNPSAFNPTADERDSNFSLLGEHVSSHWPLGKNGHNDVVNVMSGTSVATPIAAGLAASVLSFVRQQEKGLTNEEQLLGPWLKDVHSMDAVLQSMVKRRRGVGYDYITPYLLLDPNSSREHVYNKIRDIRNHMYD